MSIPAGASTDFTRKVRRATVGAVAAAAMSSESKWLNAVTSGRLRLSTEKTQKPYMVAAIQRRSMMKLSNTRSIVDTTAKTSRIGTSHQLYEVSDQVALDA